MRQFAGFVFAGKSFADLSPSKACVRLLFLNTSIMFIAIVFGIWSQYEEPGRYFREGRIMTWISTLQLFVMSYFTNYVWRLTRSQGKFSWRDQAAVWKIMSVVFFIAALDEILRIHEAIDRYSHKLLGILPTEFSDHLDDAIVALYGVVGLSALVYYWRQIPLYWRSIGYMSAAFVTAVISIILDFLSGSRTLVAKFVHDGPDLEFYVTWLAVFEEVFKIYAEVFFIAGFIYCYKIAEKKSL